jgi:hypothetical protein
VKQALSPAHLSAVVFMYESTTNSQNKEQNMSEEINPMTAEESSAMSDGFDAVGLQSASEANADHGSRIPQTGTDAGKAEKEAGKAGADQKAQKTDKPSADKPEDKTRDAKGKFAKAIEAVEKKAGEDKAKESKEKQEPDAKSRLAERLAAAEEMEKKAVGENKAPEAGKAEEEKSAEQKKAGAPAMEPSAREKELEALLAEANKKLSAAEAKPSATSATEPPVDIESRMKDLPDSDEKKAAMQFLAEIPEAKAALNLVFKLATENQKAVAPAQPDQKLSDALSRVEQAEQRLVRMQLQSEFDANVTNGFVDESGKTIEGYPQWRQIVRDLAFKEWVEAQPKAIRILMSSLDANDAIVVLDAYHQARAAAGVATHNREATARKKAIDEGLGDALRSDASSKAKESGTRNDKDDFAAGFEEV